MENQEVYDSDKLSYILIDYEDYRFKKIWPGRRRVFGIIENGDYTNLVDIQYIDKSKRVFERAEIEIQREEISQLIDRFKKPIGLDVNWLEKRFAREKAEKKEKKQLELFENI